MTLKQEQLGTKASNGRGPRMGKWKIALFIVAFCVALFMAGVAVLVAWPGGRIIAAWIGYQESGLVILGCATGLISAMLSLPLGGLLGGFVTLKQWGERSLSALGDSPIMAILFIPFRLYLEPHLGLLIGLLAPALGGWFYYSQPAATASMWTGLTMPIIGIGTGIFLTMDLTGDEE